MNPDFIAFLIYQFEPHIFLSVYKHFTIIYQSLRYEFMATWFRIMAWFFTIDWAFRIFIKFCEFTILNDDFFVSMK